MTLEVNIRPTASSASISLSTSATIQTHSNNPFSNSPNIKMQFATTILAFATAAMAAPSTQCTFGQYVCSKDGLSILQCDITGQLVVSIHSRDPVSSRVRSLSNTTSRPSDPAPTAASVPTSEPSPTARTFPRRSARAALPTALPPALTRAVTTTRTSTSATPRTS